MKTPEEHKRFLNKRDYSHQWNSVVFTQKEREFLRKRGHWVEALVTGVVLPFTPEQQRMIEVHKGIVEPATDEERAWTKLIERRRFEAKAKNTPHYSGNDESDRFGRRADGKKMRSWKSA
jgi:uncharacterized protein YifE (UPF0438 family)